jgi:hypothetical protein
MTDLNGLPRNAFRHRISSEQLSRIRRWWAGFQNTPWSADALAEQRAIELLKQSLSPRQREQYEQHRFFDVIGRSTGIRYRIHRGYQMNIEQLDGNGKHARSLCFMPRGYLPAADIMLAQKLALELFEDEVLFVANTVLADPRRFGFPPRCNRSG